jgi:hypothetical protein
VAQTEPVHHEYCIQPEKIPLIEKPFSGEAYRNWARDLTGPILKSIAASLVRNLRERQLKRKFCKELEQCKNFQPLAYIFC